MTSKADGAEATAVVCEKIRGYAITLDVGGVNGGVTLGASTDVVGEQYHHAAWTGFGLVWLRAFLAFLPNLLVCAQT